MPGIISVFTQGNPVAPIIYDAGMDVFIVAVALVAVIAAGALVEFVFKGVVGCFVGANQVNLFEAYLTFPGVVYHEFSHALFATLTGARVSSISLIPKPDESGGTELGSVTFYTRGGAFISAVQKTMASIAPSVMGLLGMGAIAIFAFPTCQEWWQWAIWIYLFVCLLLHSEMSKTDLMEAASGIPIVLIGLFVIFLFFPFDLSWWQAVLASLAAGDGWQGMTERLGDVWTAVMNNDTQGIFKAVGNLGQEATNVAHEAINEGLDVVQSATGIDTSNYNGDAVEAMKGIDNLYVPYEGTGDKSISSITEATQQWMQGMVDTSAGK